MPRRPAHLLQLFLLLPCLFGCGAPSDPGGGGGTGGRLEVSFLRWPAEATSGDVLVPAPQVELRRTDGGRSTEAAEVTVAITSGNGQLAGTTTVPVLAGVATFPDLRITGSGSQTLTFSSSTDATPATRAVSVAALPPDRGTWAFVGATVVPMDVERLLPGHTVLVENGKITAVGPDGAIPLPAGTQVIDGAGRWLMPGLVDFHTHEQALPEWPDDVAGNMMMFLANSITSIVNMGDFTGRMVGVRRAIRAGQYPGPSVYLGYFVRGPGDGGLPGYVVSSADGARALAQRAQSDGYDFLKVYDQVPAVAFNALVAEGKRLGLPIFGHTVNSVGLLEGLARGQAMAVHALNFYFSAFGGRADASAIPSVTATLKATGAAMSPTHYVSEVITEFGLDAIAGRDQFSRVQDEEGIEYMDDRTVPVWRSMLQQRADIRVPADRRAQLAFQQQFTRAFDDAGVTVLMGSDEIGIPGVVPGFSLHGEIRLMHDGGMSPFATLATGTRNPGRFLKQQIPWTESFGTVAAGQRADLVLLDANPLSDLTTLKHPAGVMAAGRWYPAAMLQAALQALRAR